MIGPHLSKARVHISSGPHWFCPVSQHRKSGTMDFLLSEVHWWRKFVSRALNVSCDLPRWRTPSDCLWRPDLFPLPADTQRHRDEGLITRPAQSRFNHTPLLRGWRSILSHFRFSSQILQCGLRGAAAVPTPQLPRLPLFSPVSLRCARLKSSSRPPPLRLPPPLSRLVLPKCRATEAFEKASGLHLAKAPELGRSSSTMW